MPMKEKRDCVCAEFPSVSRRAISAWTRQWHIELAGSPPRREPWNKGKTGVYDDETRKQMSEGGKVGAKRRWKANPHPMKDSVYQFFFSLSVGMSLKQKRKSVRERFPHLCRYSVHRWTKKWQSELEPIQTGNYVQTEFQFS